jgi:hypothetical protein
VRRMRMFMAAALAIALAGGPSLAAPTVLTVPGADRPAPPASGPARPATPPIFLSPSGEPFRPKPGGPAPFEVWFAQADADHDGSIDRAEFRADALRFFKLLDADGDGMIDGFEINTYELKIAPELIAAYEGAVGGPEVEPERGGHRGGSRDAHGRPAERIQRLIGEAEPVSGADYDLDGRVTLAEWMRATDQRFDILDAAKTGRLTRDELLARFKPGSAKGPH